MHFFPVHPGSFYFIWKHFLWHRSRYKRILLHTLLRHSSPTQCDFRYYDIILYDYYSFEGGGRELFSRRWRYGHIFFVHVILRMPTFRINYIILHSNRTRRRIKSTFSPVRFKDFVFVVITIIFFITIIYIFFSSKQSPMRLDCVKYNVICYGALKICGFLIKITRLEKLMFLS